MIDRANCSFTLAVRQILEASIGAGLERLQGVGALGRLVLLFVQTLVISSRRDSIHSVILAHGMCPSSRLADARNFTLKS